MPACVHYKVYVCCLFDEKTILREEVKRIHAFSFCGRLPRGGANRILVNNSETQKIVKGGWARCQVEREIVVCGAIKGGLVIEHLKNAAG